MDKMTIYNALPVFGQNFACSMYGVKVRKLRYGGNFKQILDEYLERGNWTNEQIVDYRDMQMQKMIKHCYDTVPYYSKQFKELGILPEDIKTIDDLKVLPIISKQDVKENFKDFISTKYNVNNLILAHTSGTTGSGFQFYTTQEAIRHQWAVWWRYRMNLGIDMNMCGAFFGSKVIVPINDSKPPYYRINKSNKQILLSGYHINNENVRSYIEVINYYKVEWIHGYPSLIALLANYLIINNLKLNYQVRFITIGAESLLEHQKKAIEYAFGVAPFQHYGSAEAVCNISETKKRELVIDEDFGIIEFIHGRKELLKSNQYEIVGTGLTNYAMPFIRYCVGDMATVQIGGSIDTTDKGRKVDEIDGRIEDYIVLKNGTKLGAMNQIFKEAINVVEAQIQQSKIGEITVLIVKNRKYSKQDEMNIKQEFIQRIGDNVVIKFVYVEKIPKEKTGKLRFVKSSIS